MANLNEIRFFLGSNTKRGFVPLFEQLRDPEGDHRLYILKGGPGSGKSSLMKRIAKTLEEHGHIIEYIPCASDPGSLDAIYDHDAKTAIIDGTAPHTMDPNYPGAYDIILNLGDAWNSDLLSQSRSTIMELCGQISLYHSMATACITSAAALLDCNRTLAKAYVDNIAIKKFISQITEVLQNSESGREHKRLLSAVTVGETLFFNQTLAALAPRLYIIPDEWGAASNQLLSGIREYALSRNLDFITCYCSIQVPDKIDHLLFPSIKLGLTTSNSFHAADSKNAILVEGLMNSIDKSAAEAMSYHLSLAKQLIAAAGDHVAKAKNLHDELEKYYIAAMDFSKVDRIYNCLVTKILDYQ
jgi:hypothetical protein